MSPASGTYSCGRGNMRRGRKVGGRMGESWDRWALVRANCNPTSVRPLAQYVWRIHGHVAAGWSSCSYEPSLYPRDQSNTLIWQSTSTCISSGDVIQTASFQVKLSDTSDSISREKKRALLPTSIIAAVLIRVPVKREDQ